MDNTLSSMTCPMQPTYSMLLQFELSMLPTQPWTKDRQEPEETRQGHRQGEHQEMWR